MIYLDHNASTHMHPSVLDVMERHSREHFANPSSSEHSAGWEATEVIESGRTMIADRIGADPDEIVFTSGATEANNLALLGLEPRRENRCNIVVSAVEHKSVLGPARELARRGIELRVAPVDEDCVADLRAMRRLIDDRTLVVAVMLVNNEVGTVQPVSEIASACAKVGALLHVDAAQAMSWMNFDVGELGADLLSISGHKCGGPKGIGALYIRRQIQNRISPLMFGGEQESGFRPGTQPTPLCIGLGTACAIKPESKEEWSAKTALLADRLLRLVPGARLNGADVDRHPGCASVTLPGIDADILIARAQPELALSRGSACTSGIPEPSHVLRAMGMSLDDIACTIRIGTGPRTSSDEIDRAARLLEQNVGAMTRAAA